MLPTRVRVSALLIALAVLSTALFTPRATAQAADPVVENPSFEVADGDRAVGWAFQDAPGVRTFIDTTTARNGAASLRADLGDSANSRVMAQINVEPNTNYTVSVWVKAENATADNWGVLVRDAGDNTRRGTDRIVLPDASGQPQPLSGPNNLTIDWTQIELTFNSDASTSVTIMLAGWNGRQGSLFWDDLSVRRSDAISAVDARNDHEWLHMSVNLVVDEVDDLLSLVDEAQAAGANGVLVSDTKVNNFHRIDYGRWSTQMQLLRSEVRDRGMEFVLITTPIGFCQPLLAANVDLATGYPVIDQPLEVRAGQLRPVQTAVLPNQGFEAAGGDEISGATFQDAPGERTFLDTSVARSGRASFRADASDGDMSRLFINATVEPHQQYTVSAWIKTANLTADNVALLVLDEESAPPTRRNFTSQDLSLAGADNRREFFASTTNLTTDWTEIRLAFNSLEATEVRLALAVFGGTQGSIWWDDLQIEATPTLNWINRSGLPQSLTTETGQALAIGTDTSVIDDPLLGESRFSGTYDTYHQAPTITVNPSAGLADGERVLLSGWHTMVTARGQVGCSWNDPAVADLIEAGHVALHELVDADGYLVNYSEIRTGGFEPFDTQHGTSGAALATSMRSVFGRVDRVTGDADLYMWSDMVDPFHNARANYYQVAGDLAGAVAGIDPQRVTVLHWSSGDRLRGDGTESDASRAAAFFAERDFDQILGAYYDEDVADNHLAWQRATADTPNVVGSLYATWVRPRDFSEVTPFGDLWWSPATD